MTCVLDNISNGGIVGFSITVDPAPGLVVPPALSAFITNRAIVTSDTNDPDLMNNEVAEETEVVTRLNHFMCYELRRQPVFPGLLGVTLDDQFGVGDVDGLDSPGDGIPGAVDVPIGAVLADFPVMGATTAGLDWFDNDADEHWTFGPGGDDLHSEDPGTCPTAIRDGTRDLGADCKILDLDASLFNGQQVDCDLEVDNPFTEPHLSNGGCPSTINDIRYHDADGDGAWDDSEDIVLDRNGNGICD